MIFRNPLNPYDLYLILSGCLKELIIEVRTWTEEVAVAYCVMITAM